MPTKWYDEHIRKVPRRQPPADNIVISDSTDDDVKEYSCPSCNRTLYRRLTEGPSITCSFCHSEFVVEDARKKSKLSVPRGRNTEVFAATTPGTEYFANQIRIKKEPEPKGSFAELKRRGLRITRYEEYNPK